MVIGKVNNKELNYRAIDFMIAEHPMLLQRLLTTVKDSLDHARVVRQLEKTGNVALAMDYLKDVQNVNVANVNEAINKVYIEDENYEDLRKSIDNYDNFDQVALASSLENHELLEFRRIAAYLFKKNEKFEKSIEISKKDNMYKDAIDTAAQSKKEEIVQGLLEFFTRSRIRRPSVLLCSLATSRFSLMWSWSLDSVMI